MISAPKEEFYFLFGFLRGCSVLLFHFCILKSVCSAVLNKMLPLFWLVLSQECQSGPSLAPVLTDKESGTELCTSSKNKQHL